MSKLFLRGFIILILVSAFTGCENKPGTSGEKKLRVVCTTSIVADAAKRIAGDRTTVSALMGPSIDPHTYEASQSDIGKLSHADVIFYNGLHLEGSMTKVLKKLAARSDQEVVAIADGVDPSRLIQLEEYNGGYDPHIWFDLTMWSSAVDFMSAVLEDTDTTNAAYYKKNATAFIGEIKDFSKWAHSKMDSLPLINRVLISAHNGFEYFGREFTIQVMGLQGLSTAQAFDSADVKRVAEFTIKNKVDTVFAENCISPRGIEAVAAKCRRQGVPVHVGGWLYSDAPGPPGSGATSYLHKYRSNINTIYKGLN